MTNQVAEPMQTAATNVTNLLLHHLYYPAIGIIVVFGFVRIAFEAIRWKLRKNRRRTDRSPFR